jgi:hypothetical protein
MKIIFAALTAGLALTATSPAFAWGDMGHEITGLIAYDRLTPMTKAKVDELLAADKDTLTPPDFASRTTWADKYRNGHRETAAWHFVDVEIDDPDLKSACFSFPALTAGQPASQGPARDCVVDKIEQFAKEFHDPKTPQAEQLLALKFLIHFVGDVHQPLHASDDHDEGGNCIGLAPSTAFQSTNLHAFWDTGVIYELGPSAAVIAGALERDITPDKALAWAKGGPRDWAAEAFATSKSDAYALPSRPTCAAPGTVALSADYQAQARHDAIGQLEKAGVRIAYVLNEALGE